MNSSRGGPATDHSVGILLPEWTFAFDLRALPDNRDHRGSLCTPLRGKSRNFYCRVGSGYHGGRLTCIPWRSLCD
jgi:hypothetical protein